MDIVQRLLWLLPMLVACKSVVPSRIVDADPVVIQHYAHPKDTAVAYLLPHPELPNEHYTALIQLARKQRNTLLVVRWKHFEEPVRFHQEVFPQRAEILIVDSTSAMTARQPVKWVVAQGEWLGVGARLAQGLKPAVFIPIDGHWQGLALEWTMAAQQPVPPVWLDSAVTPQLMGSYLERIQSNPTRDSTWMGRSYYFWNYFITQGALALPTTCPTHWFMTADHPWISEPSAATIRAIYQHTKLPSRTNQPESYNAIANWLRVQ